MGEGVVIFYNFAVELRNKFKGHWSTYLCTKLNTPSEPTHEGH